MSTNGWLEKENVASTYNGILLSLKKEGNSIKCYYMDVPWGHYAKWNKSVTQRQILYASTDMRSLK